MNTLHLYHGRFDPRQTMDDWGFEGPLLHGVKSIAVTYLNSLSVWFTSEAEAAAAKKITGWESCDVDGLWVETHEDMVVTTDPDGTKKYYGDWSLTVDKEGNVWGTPTALNWAAI